MVNIFIRQMAQQTECREKNYGQKSDIHTKHAAAHSEYIW